MARLAGGEGKAAPPVASDQTHRMEMPEPRAGPMRCLAAPQGRPHLKKGAEFGGGAGPTESALGVQKLHSSVVGR